MNEHANSIGLTTDEINDRCKDAYNEGLESLVSHMKLLISYFNDKEISQERLDGWQEFLSILEHQMIHVLYDKYDGV